MNVRISVQFHRARMSAQHSHHTRPVPRASVVVLLYSSVNPTFKATW